MKKLFILGIILVLVVACGKKEELSMPAPVEPTPLPVQESVVVESPPAEPVPPPPAVPEAPPVVETPPAPVDQAVLVEKPEELSPELRELLQKADQKVKSYKYLFSLTLDNKEPHSYFVKGQYIKVKLYELDPYNIDNYYDMVYLDTKNKKAYAYCENTKRCMSRDVDNTKKVYNVSYDEYRVETPYEYLKDITFAEIVGPEVVENRDTVKIKEVKGDVITEIWLDSAYGMPRRIRVTQGEKVLKTLSFQDMTFNTLKDEDVWRAPK